MNEIGQALLDIDYYWSPPGYCTEFNLRWRFNGAKVEFQNAMRKRIEQAGDITYEQFAEYMGDRITVFSGETE